MYRCVRALLTIIAVSGISAPVLAQPAQGVVVDQTGLPLPGANDAFVHVIVPVPPTAGTVQPHPAASVIDWNVVLAGVFSVKVALVALLGPLLVTTCV